MSYCVYKHTFPNGKIYIGITGQKPNQRWDNGKGYVGQSRIARAIIEYGWDNIAHEILYDNLTEDEARQIEGYLISKYKSDDIEYGYNVSSGRKNKKKEKNNSIDDYVYRPNYGFVFSNQKVVHINKPTYDSRFLVVGIDEWMKASTILKPNTFKLYLYLASNVDGFDLALSRQDVMDKLSISKDSYIRAVKELEKTGYLVCKQGFSYDFYTSPANVQ